jgi:hypothetical protein
MSDPIKLGMLGIGFRHFIVGFPAPHDAESMERLITEVKPMLEATERF